VRTLLGVEAEDNGVVDRGVVLAQGLAAGGANFSGPETTDVHRLGAAEATGAFGTDFGVIGRQDERKSANLPRP
jgi:hypothetical protein